MNAKSFNWAVRCATEIRNQFLWSVWYGLPSDILKENRLNWKIEKVTRQMTLSYISRRYVTPWYREKCRN